jgi:hypothetical protein
MLAGKGLAFENDEATETALARLIRKGEGPPFWNIDEDENALKSLLERSAIHIGDGTNLQANGRDKAATSLRQGSIVMGSGRDNLQANGGDGATTGFVLPSLPQATLDLDTMSPESAAAAGGWIANLNETVWMFDASSPWNKFARNGMEPTDWREMRRHQKQLAELKQSRAGFHLLEDQAIDISHVKPKVDCGQHARRKNARKKKKRKRAKRIQLPAWESPVAAIQSGSNFLSSQQVANSNRRSKPMRLMPLETVPRMATSSPAPPSSDSMLNQGGGIALQRSEQSI